MARCVRCRWQRVWIGSAVVAVLLIPATATAASTDDVAAWARHVAAPRLAAELAERQDDVGTILADLLRENIPTDTLPDTAPRDPRFWHAAVQSREATYVALAAHLITLAADGDLHALTSYSPLLAELPEDGSAAVITLHELAQRLSAAEPAASVPVATLELADAALDDGNHALAAFAYRLVLLNDRPRDYDYRDIPGHYFYCLYELGALTDVQSSRARFNRTVVFPSVQAQSRARSLETPSAAETLTAAE